MTLQEAARIARVLTKYETQPTEGEHVQLAQMLEEAFPKYSFVWSTKSGRYEVLFNSDGSIIRSVVEEGEQP